MNTAQWQASALYQLWKEFVFFTGDIRLMHSFPYVTWAKDSHRVSYDEILEALPRIEYGDVGIHRDWGYLSNIAIPGFMKHAWIHVEDGSVRPKIVEAVSEGVLYHSPVYPMASDFTVILSPKGVSDADRKGACLKAKQIVGASYDVDFQFDIEYELKYYQGTDPDGASRHLRRGQANLQRYVPGFSCTEAVSYAWWHRREQLHLVRHLRRGKDVILADDFFNDGWEIKWMSRSVTPERARREGLHKTGVAMIADFLRRR